MSSELAWAAGLFEGEGSVCAATGYKGRLKLSMNLHSTDEDVVRRFHKVVGVGTSYGPYVRPNAKSHHKPIWTWRVGNCGLKLLNNPDFILHLGVRRRAKIEEVIALLEYQKPPYGARVTHCKQGHEYDEKNTYIPGPGVKGGRRCRTCARERAREAKIRQKCL